MHPKSNPFFLLVLLTLNTAALGDTTPPTLTFRKDLTLVDSPLLPDGTIDFYAALDAKCAAGVTPESNVAAGIVALVASPQEDAWLFQSLGVPLSKDRKGRLNLEDSDDVDSLLDQLKQAIARPRYFVPLSDGHGGRRGSGTTNFEGDIGEALRQRALQRAAKGEWPEAWSDLAADFRLASLLESRHELRVEREFAQTLRTIRQIADTHQIPAPVLRTWIAELQKIKEPFLSPEMLEWTRFEQLGRVMRMVRGDPKVFNEVTGLQMEDLFDLKGPAPRWQFEEPDWNLLISDMAKDADEFSQVLRSQTPATAKAYAKQVELELAQAGAPDTFAQIVKDPQDLNNERSSYEERRLRMVDATRRYFRQRPGETPAQYTARWALLQKRDLSALANFIVFRALLVAQLRVTIAGLAARLYREGHGTWPDNLDSLLQSGLAKIPEDPFNPAKPLSFLRTPSTLLIYSVGQNGKDDQGLSDRPSKKDDEAW